MEPKTRAAEQCGPLVELRAPQPEEIASKMEPQDPPAKSKAATPSSYSDGLLYCCLSRLTPELRLAAKRHPLKRIVTPHLYGMTPCGYPWKQPRAQQSPT